MSDKITIRPWMLAYTVVFGLLSILFVQNDFSQYPMAYAAVGALLYLTILGGNLLYSFGCLTPAIRSFWKVVFPLVVLYFVVAGAVDARFGKHSHDKTVVSLIIVWIIGFVLFLPTFRAHFLLGHGRTKV